MREAAVPVDSPVKPENGNLDSALTEFLKFVWKTVLNSFQITRGYDYFIF